MLSRHSSIEGLRSYASFHDSFFAEAAAARNALASGQANSMNSTLPAIAGAIRVMQRAPASTAPMHAVAAPPAGQTSDFAGDNDGGDEDEIGELLSLYTPPDAKALKTLDSNEQMLPRGHPGKPTHCVQPGKENISSECHMQPSRVLQQQQLQKPWAADGYEQQRVSHSY